MYKLELHLHTKRNSFCAKVKPRDIIDIYKAAGYDGIVCTNHYNEGIVNINFAFVPKKKRTAYYLKDYHKLKKYGEKHGVDVFFGMELALRGEEYTCQKSRKENLCAEILVYGITPEQFCEYGEMLFLLSHAELFDLANEKGWLLYQAHPFRAHSKLLDTQYLHGVETQNMHPGHDNHSDKAEAYAREHEMLRICGSDFHFRGGDGGGILTDKKPSNETELVAILRSGAYKMLSEEE